MKIPDLLMKIEIIHDQLAKYAFDLSSTDKKALLRAENIVKTRFKYYQDDKNLLLSSDDLAFIKPFSNDLRLTTEEQSFLAYSQLKAKQIQRRNRNRNYALVALSMVVILLPMAMMGWYNASLAKKEATVAHKEKKMFKDSLKYAMKKANSYRKVIERGDESLKVVSWDEMEDIDNTDLRGIDMTYATILVTGKVKNKYNKAIPAATIDFMGAKVKTDRRGIFELFFILPPLLIAQRNLKLTVSKDGFDTLKYEVTPESKLELEFQLEADLE